MSDDLGTVNYKRGDRAREIEVMRARYRRHREALDQMVADAPTEALAGEYERLIESIDGSLRKLDELEGRGSAPAPPAPAIPPPLRQTEPGNRPLHRSSSEARVDPFTAPSEPGVQPVAEPIFDQDTQADYIPPEEPTSRPVPGSRLMLILFAGLALLGLIGWLIWKASSDRAPDLADTGTVPVVEQPVGDTTDAADAAAPATTNTRGRQPAAAAAGELAATPPSHDYGVIRKGTRATRQYEIANNTEQPMTVTVARSACRCLYYEYGTGLIPPKAKESITVTIDGAKAPAGALNETIRVTSKSDPSVGTSFDVIATIQ
jgi:hypothetical protein